MTIKNVTPTGDTNQDAPVENPVDNMGNPVDETGKPVEKTTDDTPDDQSPEALAKALKDTKAELTRLQQEKAKEKKPEGDGENPNLQIDKAKEEAEKKGVDFSKYSTEFNAEGQLSEDSYKELESKGYDRQIVDDYIAGQKARMDKQTQEVAAVVGGEQNLPTVLAWAAEHLSAEEIDFYNKSVNSGTAAAKLALQGIHARYVEANGEAPELINGGSTATSSGIFKSPFEMQKAMDDKRYWNDPDYQQEVQDKIKRSAKAGTV